MTIVFDWRNAEQPEFREDIWSILENGKNSYKKMLEKGSHNSYGFVYNLTVGDPNTPNLIVKKKK